jgi:hypothetical protein
VGRNYFSSGTHLVLKNVMLHLPIFKSVPEKRPSLSLQPPDNRNFVSSGK